MGLMAWKSGLPMQFARPEGTVIACSVWYTRSILLGSGMALQILLVLVYAKKLAWQLINWAALAEASVLTILPSSGISRILIPSGNVHAVKE